MLNTFCPYIKFFNKLLGSKLCSFITLCRFGEPDQNDTGSVESAKYDFIKFCNNGTVFGLVFMDPDPDPSSLVIAVSCHGSSFSNE